jgi:hypothetical protein
MINNRANILDYQNKLKELEDEKGTRPRVEFFNYLANNDLTSSLEATSNFL